MQIILIIASVVLFMMSIIVPVLMLTNMDDMKWYHVIAILITILSLLIGTICVGKTASNYNEPKPIDVYRGKTTLQITYVDSIPQDTIVIFK